MRSFRRNVKGRYLSYHSFPPIHLGASFKANFRRSVLFYPLRPRSFRISMSLRPFNHVVTVVFAFSVFTCYLNFAAGVVPTPDDKPGLIYTTPPIPLPPSGKCTWKYTCCKGKNQACCNASDCCSGYYCSHGKCNCGSEHSYCSSTSPCCSGLVCKYWKCQKHYYPTIPPCGGSGQPCCDGYKCNSYGTLKLRCHAGHCKPYCGKHYCGGPCLGCPLPHKNAVEVEN